MSKYIDADRLKAEIEKTYKSEIQPWLSGVSATSAIYDYVLPIIDSLQQEQPEVDLEKFINDFIDKKDSENQGKWCEEDIIEAMKSSFNLGLNARKED